MILISSPFFIWSLFFRTLPELVKNVIIGPSISSEGRPGTSVRLEATPTASSPLSNTILNFIFAKPSLKEMSFGTRNFGDIVLFEYVKEPLNNSAPFSKKEMYSFLDPK